MEHEMNVNLEVSQHLEEKLADEAEERRLECDQRSVTARVRFPMLMIYII
jgi:hypothetical protein